MPVVQIVGYSLESHEQLTQALTAARTAQPWVVEIVGCPWTDDTILREVPRLCPVIAVVRIHDCVHFDLQWAVAKSTTSLPFLIDVNFAVQKKTRYEHRDAGVIAWNSVDEIVVMLHLMHMHTKDIFLAQRTIYRHLLFVFNSTGPNTQSYDPRELPIEFGHRLRLETTVEQDRDSGARHLVGQELLDHLIMKTVDCDKCGFGNDDHDGVTDLVKHTGIFFSESRRKAFMQRGTNISGPGWYLARTPTACETHFQDVQQAMVDEGVEMLDSDAIVETALNMGPPPAISQVVCDRVAALLKDSRREALRKAAEDFKQTQVWDGDRKATEDRTQKPIDRQADADRASGKMDRLRAQDEQVKRNNREGELANPIARVQDGGAHARATEQ